MYTATSMFPFKAATPGKDHTLPHHLWPKEVLHDFHALRTRTKALRRLAAETATTPLLTMESIATDESPHHHHWLRVTTPLTLRTKPPPPIWNLETLILTDVPEKDDDTPPSTDLITRINACFKAHRRTTRLLLKHARN
jgi:hypothetical protein